MSDPLDSLSRDDLRKQYDATLLEYRFQIQLNWDRAKHYLVFNTALFGAAVALYKDARSWAPQAAVGALLTVAAINSFLGQWAVEKGHEFYQETRDLKTRLEVKLGLGEYAIAPTPGMKRGHDRVVAGAPDNSIFRASKIVNQIRLLLCVIGVFAGFGALYATCTACSSFYGEPQVAPAAQGHEQRAGAAPGH